MDEEVEKAIAKGKNRNGERFGKRQDAQVGFLETGKELFTELFFIL